jgi:serine protease
MVPSGFPEVIAVASTTAIGGANQCPRLAGAIAADTASYFTTDGAFSTATGIGVTISAPGEEREDVNRACFISSTGILSLAPGGGTARMSGTSQAAPHVAGVAARVLWVNASLSPDGIRQQLILTADKKGIAPLNSPTSSYSFDGQREGITKAP